MNKPKHTIGRVERVHLPEWHLHQIPAKVDTGAYSCAIHCENIHHEKGKDGMEVLSFTLLDPGQPQYHGKVFQTQDFTTKKVKSSTGEMQERFLVRTIVQLFGENFEADFTLTNRKSMRFPVLLGRKLLKKNFLVDVDRKNLSRKYLEKKS